MTVDETRCPDTVRVCSAQFTSSWEDPEKSLARAEILVKHAADCGAEMICFPEQFATGWDPASRKNIQTPDESIVTALRGFAQDHRIAILGSFRERSTPLPKNTALAIGSDGQILASYAKIHLFSPSHEQNMFISGTELGIFSLGSLTCGIAVCYDLRFPALFRVYAHKGVHAVFVPSAWPRSRIRIWELFVTARAAENQMYVIGVNTTGKTPVDTYSGASVTADPNGVIVSRANDAEQLLFSEIDPGEVERVRKSFPVEKDCRDSLYQALLD
ncbi:MAG TPA: nitrilase-related carbon-nitrogen hydrolase [Methanoregula sp.]|nr:nitrilase-related carbon-nitrogen hydrolase [Methanoregula sp.]